MPDRQGFNPYRRGLLIASYYPNKLAWQRFESGTFVNKPGELPLDGNRSPPPRRMLRSDWFPSGTRYASGPYHLDWEAVDSWADIEQRLSGRTFWLLTKFAERMVWEASFSPGDVLVFGSETRGLPEQLRLQHHSRCLKLPMHEAVRSLNLASTANTVIYEAVRQFGGLGF